LWIYLLLAKPFDIKGCKKCKKILNLILCALFEHNNYSLISIEYFYAWSVATLRFSNYLSSEFKSNNILSVTVCLILFEIIWHILKSDLALLFIWTWPSCISAWSLGERSYELALKQFLAFTLSVRYLN